MTVLDMGLMKASRYQFFNLFAQQLTGRITEQLLEFFVDINHIAMRIHDDHRDWHGLYDMFETDGRVPVDCRCNIH